MRNRQLAIACALVCSFAPYALAAGDCKSASENERRGAFNRFVDQLLVDHKPRMAFETYARSDLIQHSAAFGSNRETTIAQYERMFASPGAQFWIDGVTTEGQFGSVRFHGVLDPKMPGAHVVVYFRFDCGLIAETWDSFQIDK